jgi:hypothetical protein
MYIRGNNLHNQETTHRMGKKIFACYSLDEGLIFTIYKELKKINIKRTNNTTNK